MIVARNMARVELPDEFKSEVLKLYLHESYGREPIVNYIYKEGVAFLPLNRRKLIKVAELLGEKITDERSEGEPLLEPFVVNPDFKFRSHQGGPAQELLEFTRKYKYSVLEAPCSCGKTVVNTWVAGQLQRKTLVLVDQNTLADQWRAAFKIVYNREAQIVDREHMDSFGDVCIATFQFLHRNPELVRRMRDVFGCCLIDEFQISAADTYRAVLFKLSNKYRIGTSATVIKKGYESDTLTDLVADISVKMTDENALIPEIRFLETGVPFCSDNPDDYTMILGDLAENSKRNRLLLDLIRELVAEDRRILYVGMRKNSLTYLCNEVTKFAKAKLYIGTTTLAQDIALKEGIEDGSIQVVFSEKKFEKGVDAPRLDTLINAKPMNNETTVVQVAGRTVRPMEGKPQPLVIDVVDKGELARKWAGNRYRWYTQRKYDIAASDIAAILEMYQLAW